MKTLEELLALLNAAKEKSAAAPTDKSLQTELASAQKAYDDAKAAADDLETDPPIVDPDAFDESKADEKTKRYIKKLRDEAAKHRTGKKSLADELAAEKVKRNAILKAAGIEIETEKPEEKIKSLTEANSNQAFRTAILESALQHGISHDSVEYYEFLVTKATSELGEGEELEDDKLAEIVGKVKLAGKKPAASTSVTGDDGKKKPGSDGQISLEKFCSMSITEKSALYVKDQGLYTELFQQAKAKRKLV